MTRLISARLVITELIFARFSPFLPKKLDRWTDRPTDQPTHPLLKNLDSVQCTITDKRKEELFKVNFEALPVVGK